MATVTSSPSAAFFGTPLSGDLPTLQSFRRDSQACSQLSSQSSHREATIMTPASASSQFAFWPSDAEMSKALGLLDRDGDGKVWEEDLDMLIELAYGVNARDCTESSSWAQWKASLSAKDGMIELGPVRAAIESARILEEVGSMPVSTRFEELEGGGEQAAGFDKGEVEKGFKSFKDICDYIEAFQELDIDGNGVICTKDLKGILEGLHGKKFSVEECQDMMRKVDANSNGVLDLCELPLLYIILKLA